MMEEYIDYFDILYNLFHYYIQHIKEGNSHKLHFMSTFQSDNFQGTFLQIMKIHFGKINNLLVTQSKRYS